MDPKTLPSKLLHKMNACWRAFNYLSVGQIYLAKYKAPKSKSKQKSDAKDNLQKLPLPTVLSVTMAVGVPFAC